MITIVALMCCIICIISYMALMQMCDIALVLQANYLYRRPHTTNYVPFHWVPSTRVGRILLKLERKGILVLNLGTIDGVSALLICDKSYLNIA